jgi:hypothetical protein
VCLQRGEKPLVELEKLSRLSYGTLRKYIGLLLKDGTIQRRWSDASGYSRYLYKLIKSQ